MRHRYLMGITGQNEIVLANLYIKDDGKFSVSFDIVRPFNADSFDLEDYIKECIDDYGKEWMYDRCVDYDCKPSELANELAYNTGVYEWVDCSLYPEEVEIGCDMWLFETVGCGQHDTRGSMKELTNVACYDYIYFLWDNYHMKELPDCEVGHLNNVLDVLSEIDEEGTIKRYIMQYII